MSRLEDYDQFEFRKFTAKAEIDKAVHTLEGIIKGITIDEVINPKEYAELRNWYHTYQHLINTNPFGEILQLLSDCMKDGIIDDEEKKDIMWTCKRFYTRNIYFDMITADLQRLQGIFHGIMADNEIGEIEVARLAKWLDENTHLTGYYPYDEICSLLVSILQDGYISDHEKDILKVFFSEFIDQKSSLNVSEEELMALKEQITIQGICAVCPEITFGNRVFCFTGKSSTKSRIEMKQLVEQLGGSFSNNVTKSVDYLVVGSDGNPCWAFSCYGRKVEKAINLRKQGHKILIVHEYDFWDAVEDLC